MGIIINPFKNERIIRNYRGGDLSAGQLIYLFEHKIAFGAEKAARILVKLLTENTHSNLRSHNEGSKDKTIHYTIWVIKSGHRSGYHLRLDARHIVFQITDNRGYDLGTIPGWVAPGSCENG